MTESTSWSHDDLRQFKARGATLADVDAQLELLRHPPAPIVLDQACILGDGVVRIESAEEEALAITGATLAGEGRLTKFVPASGAATRMFKELITAWSDPGLPSSSSAAQSFFERLDLFPFAGELRRRGLHTGSPSGKLEERRLLDVLLVEMRFGVLPKGLIPFHRSAGGVHSAFDEQLREGVRLVRDREGLCRMHFTVAREFRSHFEAALTNFEKGISGDLSPSTLSVEFSEQHPATDTIALDAAGNPFRLSDGSILFRPGGHGALLHNLGSLEGDVVIIKNIDNILPDESNDEVLRWKRILLGYLSRLEQETQAMWRVALAATSQAEVEAAVAFASSRFARVPAQRLESLEEKRRFAVDALDRPLRICGVVRNEGEPGGAPFWVTGVDGGSSLQIVEAAQVDRSDPEQVRIFASSTHFNPVDIVASLRSGTGQPFELQRFVDPAAVFISQKSFEGRELHALERPGLWNGAMAHWNTICVEVPAATFAPVKSVFDLLRPEHQQNAHGNERR